MALRSWVALSRPDEMPAWITTLAWIWLGGHLLAGASLLALRALSPGHRTQLAPIALGALAGTGPYVVLNALPGLLGLPSVVGPEIAALSLAVLPVAFAYVILRHHLFSLDILLRRGATRITAAAVMFVLLALLWLLLDVAGIDAKTGGLAAAALVALAAPTIWRRTRHYLDIWLYARLDPSLPARQLFESESVESVATTVVRHVRELLPMHWAACAVCEPCRTGKSEETAWCLVASEGALLPPLPRIAAGNVAHVYGDAATAILLEHAGLQVGALLLGSRLDGAPLSRRDFAAIGQLTGPSATLVEVALRRARAAEDELFREDLEALRRALAAANSHQELLDMASEHLGRLLRSERTAVRLRRDGGVLERRGTNRDAVRDAVAGESGLLVPTVLQRLDGNQPIRLRAEGLDGPLLAHEVRCGPQGRLLLVATRWPDERPFTGDDEWRMRDIAHHVSAELAGRETPEPSPAETRVSGQVDSLTPREREVVRLVAQGFTNRQVAQELVISEKTAGKHLENIMAKLSFQSRAQVAAWAVQQRATPRALASSPDSAARRTWPEGVPTM